MKYFVECNTAIYNMKQSRKDNFLFSSKECVKNSEFKLVL